MGRIIFITGTGTGVGKTVVTGLLLAHLRGQGRNVLALKPCSACSVSTRSMACSSAAVGTLPLIM